MVTKVTKQTKTTVKKHEVTMSGMHKSSRQLFVPFLQSSIFRYAWRCQCGGIDVVHK